MDDGRGGRRRADHHQPHPLLDDAGRVGDPAVVETGVLQLHGVDCPGDPARHASQTRELTRSTRGEELIIHPAHIRSGLPGPRADQLHLLTFQHPAEGRTVS